MIVLLLFLLIKYTNMEVKKPFLKWVGGKTQILDELMMQFPKHINNYLEPFLGGGSVLIALLTCKMNGVIQVDGKIFASDLNPMLISLYKHVQTSPMQLISEVKKISDEYRKCKIDSCVIENSNPLSIEDAMSSPKSYYYWTRNKFNSLSKENRCSVHGSAMFLFLNKTCFRGLYREGPNGFNVPFGNYKNPTIIDEEHIQYLSKLFKDVIFSCNSFEILIGNAQRGDFVYLDPPYAPESDISFVSYTKQGFDMKAIQHLFHLCSGMKEKEVRMLMSNSEVEFVKTTFSSPLYKTKIISCKRAINSKNPTARTNEVLISNFTEG